MATFRLSPQDALWLTMDRPNNLMVVDAVVVLDGQPAFASVRRTFEEAIERFPVLARRPVKRGRTWVWTKDHDFDIDRHVREVPLMGTMSTLQEYVGQQRSIPLDKDHPVWVADLVGPIVMPDGAMGSAIVVRFHHAIADGVRLTQILLGMCDATDGTIVPPVARSGVRGPEVSVVAAATGTALGLTRVSVSTLRSAAGEAWGAAASVGGISSPSELVDAAVAVPARVTHRVRQGVAVVRHPDWVMDAFESAGGPSYRSVNDVGSVAKLLLGGSDETTWSGTPGVDKSVSWSPRIPLDRVKQAARRRQATVNDVLVSAVAGGLRRYLDDLGASVGEVTWMVPVNLKPFEDEIPEDLGNHFALVMLGMPLHHDDADERLVEIRKRMQRIKNSDEAVITFGVQRGVSMTPSAVAESVTNFFANKAIGVLTNVPGPTGRMSFCGQDVVQVLGFAPCSGNQPLTATIFTYDGSVTIGFAADADLVPHLSRLVDHVVAEVGELTRP